MIIILLNNPVIREVDILIIQESWQNVHTKSSYNPKNSRFFLLYKEEAGIRTCLYINKRIDINSWEKIFPSKDVYTITLKLREENADIEEDSI